MQPTDPFQQHNISAQLPIHIIKQQPHKDKSNILNRLSSSDNKIRQLISDHFIVLLRVNNKWIVMVNKRFPADFFSQIFVQNDPKLSQFGIQKLNFDKQIRNQQMEQMLVNNSSKISIRLRNSIKINSNQSARCPFIPYIIFKRKVFTSENKQKYSKQANSSLVQSSSYSSIDQNLREQLKTSQRIKDFVQDKNEWNQAINYKSDNQQLLSYREKNEASSARGTSSQMNKSINIPNSVQNSIKKRPNQMQDLVNLRAGPNENNYTCQSPLQNEQQAQEKNVKKMQKNMSLPNISKQNAVKKNIIFKENVGSGLYSKYYDKICKNPVKSKLVCMIGSESNQIGFIQSSYANAIKSKLNLRGQKRN